MNSPLKLFRGIFVLMSIITLNLGIAFPNAFSHEGPTAPHQYGLHFKNNTLYALATFPSTPLVGHENRLTLEFQDASTHQTVLVSDKVQVVLWMPDMGHGSAPTRIQPHRDAQGSLVPGIYEVANLYFTMPGEWLVKVQLKASNGQTETQSFSLMMN